MDVRQHEQDQAAEAERDARKVARRIARLENQTRKQQHARNGEAVEEHDAGDARVLVRANNEEIGFHVNQRQQGVNVPGDLRAGRVEYRYVS